MDLFNTHELGDIPESLKNSLRKDEFADQIHELFKLVGAGHELSVDAITVAHYRKFIADTSKEPKSKNAIMAKLYAMANDKKSQPLIESVNGKKGMYRLKREMLPKIDTDGSNKDASQESSAAMPQQELVQ